MLTVEIVRVYFFGVTELVGSGGFWETVRDCLEFIGRICFMLVFIVRFLFVF